MYDMRAVVQRVTRANVRVHDEIIGEIANGLVVLLGMARDDTEKDASYLAEKIAALRIFESEKGVMNVSVKDVNGGMLVVSQFIFMATCGVVCGLPGSTPRRRKWPSNGSATISIRRAPSGS